MTLERKHQMGAGGFCVCPRCDHKTPHQSGMRCIEQKCPKCGAKMLREGSQHHQKVQSKKK